MVWVRIYRDADVKRPQARWRVARAFKNLEQCGGALDPVSVAVQLTYREAVADNKHFITARFLRTFRFSSSGTEHKCRYTLRSLATTSSITLLTSSNQTCAPPAAFLQLLSCKTDSKFVENMSAGDPTHQYGRDKDTAS